MGVITTTITWADGDQVTSTKLNEIPDGSEFSATAVVGSTLTVVGGQLKVGTITSSELGALSVSTAAIQDVSVTTGKIADGAITTGKIGNLAITGAKIAGGTIDLGRFPAANYANQSAVENGTALFWLDGSNAKYIPGAAKAYGSFAITGAGRTIQDNSLNIASLTRVSATQTTVTLATNMNSANYTVLASAISDGTEIVQACSYDRAAGNFKIRHTTEGPGRGVTFAVYGKYA